MDPAGTTGPSESGASNGRAQDEKKLARECLMMQPGHCESCPACGHWDGYGPWKMGPGQYCFYTAYFKGKAARPVPIAEVQNACPQKDDPNLCGN